MPLPRFVAVLALLLSPSGTSAQTVLTLDRVIELASTRNPQVVQAATRETQAAGRLADARVRLADNPSFDLFIGPRQRPAPLDALTDLELSVVQPFEIGGQRGHRTNAAAALLTQRRAETAALALDATATAVRAFYRALHAQQLRDIADDALKVTDEMVRAAEARYEAGETAWLPVNLARVEQARAVRDRLEAVRLTQTAYGTLRAVLALSPDEALAVSGAWPSDEAPSLEALIAAIPDRPDLAALVEAAAVAESERRLIIADQRPDIVAGLGVRREGGESSIGAKIGMSLPVFQRHDGAAAAAAARVAEAQTAGAAARQIYESRLRSAHAAYQAARESAAVLDQGVAPLLEENVGLAQESYAAGKIGLIELLVVRRETVAARREVLQSRLDLALALTEVRAAAGRFE